MSKKIYIAGKMTGLPEYNYPRFYKAEKVLKKIQGVGVVNPARIACELFGWKYNRAEYEIPPHFSSKLIEVELRQLALCDSIYLLKGWETSIGAKKELQVALALGLEVICE